MPNWTDLYAVLCTICNHFTIAVCRAFQAMHEYKDEMLKLAHTSAEAQIPNMFPTAIFILFFILLALAFVLYNDLVPIFHL